MRSSCLLAHVPGQGAAQQAVLPRGQLLQGPRAAALSVRSGTMRALGPPPPPGSRWPSSWTPSLTAGWAPGCQTCAQGGSKGVANNVVSGYAGSSAGVNGKHARACTLPRLRLCSVCMHAPHIVVVHLPPAHGPPCPAHSCCPCAGGLMPLRLPHWSRPSTTSCARRCSSTRPTPGTLPPTRVVGRALGGHLCCETFHGFGQAPDALHA